MIAYRFVASVALCAAGLAVGPAASAAVEHGPEAATAASGTQLWASRYSGLAAGNNQAYAAAVSPDGSTVFVTGAVVTGTGAGQGYGTVAYNAATGARLWAHPDSAGVQARAVAVSPGGTEVFVAGQGKTVAYRASTGARLWASSYGGGAVSSTGYAVTVSPDGSRVFVTGSAPRSGGGNTYDTVAYRAATGTTLWARRFSGPDSTGSDDAYSIAVSPDGTKVFVTGAAQVSSTVSAEFATVAYDAATGAQVWARQYRSSGAFAEAVSLAVSPDGSKVVVTGSAGLSNGTTVYETIAYGTAVGTQLWAARYASSGGLARAESAAVSPDASRVFVTGWSVDGIGRHFYTTVAYDAATGAQVWVGRYSGIFASQLAISPDGSKVFVTGEAPGTKPGATDYGTVAYNAATGAQVWARHYGTGGADTARAVAASAAGVFVTGYIGFSCGFDLIDTCYDDETVAYQP